MAKLPLITVVTPDSGPAKLEAIPKVEGGDSRGYFDTETSKLVVEDFVINSQSAGILKTDVDGNVGAVASIGHAEVDGLGNLALVDSVDLSDGEVTGVLDTSKGGTGKSNITAGSLLLGAGTDDMTELAGTATGQVVKWNNTTHTWYAGTESGGGGGGGSVDSVTGNSPITVDNTDPANPVVGIDQSSIAIAASQVSGLAAVATSGSASDITTGTLAKERQEAQAMGGDISGTTAAATVTKIQGHAFSDATPSNGQVPVWANGQWVPGANATGGGGGGGVAFYLDNNTSYTGNGLPNTTYLLNRTASPSLLTPITVNNVSNGGSWTRVAAFVTAPNDPNASILPAGIWDYNFWFTSSAAANEMSFRVTLWAYDGSTNPESGTVIGQSVASYLYDPSQSTQYITSVVIAQTTFTNKRVYVLVEATCTKINQSIVLNMGDSKVSHVHTTIPAVTGTGLYKVVDGVPQTPATYLVDADVDASAAIARTKLAASVSGDKGKLLMNDASSGAIVAAAYASVAQGGLGTGSNTAGSGKILVGSGSAFVEQTMGGDATIGSNGTLTLANSGVSAGTKGGAAKSAVVVVNAKGLVTSLTEVDISLTSSALPSEVVYTDTVQTVSGNKTFSGELTFSNAGLTASRILRLDSNNKVASGYVSNADVATDAAIARDKLAAGSAANSLVVNNATDKKLTELAISVTSGHVLKSNGTAATWGTIDIGSTNSVTGTLLATNGGTGQSSYAVGDLLYANTTTTLAKLADVTTGNALISGGVDTAPSWGKIGLTTHVSGTLGATNGGTGQSTWTQGDILYSSAANTLSKLGAGTAGYVLKTGGAGANPSWAAMAYDIADRYTGLPTLNQVLTRFLAGRSFTLVAANTVCNSLVASSGATAAVLTLYRTRSGTKNIVGTITFSATSTGVVSSFNASYTSIQSGDIITLEMTTLDSGGTFASPYFTIGGYQV